MGNTSNPSCMFGLNRGPLCRCYSQVSSPAHATHFQLKRPTAAANKAVDTTDNSNKYISLIVSREKATAPVVWREIRIIMQIKDSIMRQRYINQSTVYVFTVKHPLSVFDVNEDLQLETWKKN